MTLRRILIYLIIFVISKSVAQVNYVNNPSFEAMNSQTVTSNFTSNCYYWKALDSTKQNGIGACYWWDNMPGIGYCKARTGKNKIRQTFYCTPATCTYTNSRYYPRNTLKSTLSFGITYCVKMYVQRQEVCPYNMADFQIYFGDNSLDTTKYCTLPLTYLSPQITNTLGIISDTANWVEVSGTFVANGTEKYLVLGCFKPDTNITRSPTGLAFGDWAEYFVDDVSVVDFNLPASAGPNKNINLGDSAFIGRPPEVGLECTWTSGSFTVGTGGGLWVKPTTPGTYSYVVTQNICGNIKTDTVNVNVSPSLISEHTLFGQSINLFPQPSNDIVKLTFRNYSEETISIEIQDTNGKTVYLKDEYLRNNFTIIRTDNLSDGIYYLKIKNSKDQFATKKLTVTH